MATFQAKVFLPWPSGRPKLSHDAQQPPSPHSTRWMLSFKLHQIYKVIPPYAAATYNKEVGQCRLLCPLLAKYAALALQQPTFTPNKFWHRVIHQVIADGNAMPWSELLLGARLAFHQCIQGDGTVATANVSDALMVPVPDAEVLDHVSSWLQADLPDCAPQASAVAVQLNSRCLQHWSPTNSWWQ